jgi:hypothetical protein
MSFRLFAYYCAAWGAAAAYFGWMLGRLLEGDAGLMAAAVKGMALGVCVSLGLGLLDTRASGSQRDSVSLVVRLGLTLLIGAFGGLVGGFVGQGLYQLSDGQWGSLLVLGWMLTGLLIGAAPVAFDFLGAVLRNEDRRGAHLKLRNGLLGGTLGGLVGGLLSLFLHRLWAMAFQDADAQSLWSPSATGFVALGACIGLAVALAQIIFREAWLRVDAGFRPGRQILLTKPETTIGRAEACDIGLFGDAATEKLHARIVREGNRWILADAGPQAATLLNGQRLTGSVALRSGDRIQIGNSVLSFGVRNPESPATPAVVPMTS